MKLALLNISVFLLIGFQSSIGQETENVSLSSRAEKRIQQKKEVIDSLLKADSSEKKLARIYNDISWIFLNSHGDYKEAEKYNRLGDSLAFLIQDTSLMAESQTIKGRLYMRSGYFASSLETQKVALELKSALRDTGRMAYSINLMARVFFTQKKYKEALDFYMKSVNLVQEAGFTKISFLVLRSMALCNLYLGDIPKAREYIVRAASMVEEGSRKSGRAHLVFAEIEYTEKNYELALSHCKKSEEYLQNKGVRIDVAVVQVLLSRILFQMDQIELSEQKANSAYNLAKLEDHPMVLIDALEILESIASLKNKYKEAHLLNKEIKMVRDSFYSTEDLIKTRDFETLYKLKEKEKEIALLEKEKEENLKDLAVKEKQKAIMGSILLVSSLLLSALLWFLYYKNKKDKVIAQKDHTIQDQKIKELEHEQKTIRLQSMIEGQEKERLRLSQDIHDSLGGLLSTAKTYLSEKNGSDSNIKNIIDQSCEEVREITNNLMPVALKVVGLSGAIEDLASRVEIIGIECETEIHNLNIENENSRLAIYRIVQELVNNVIKHASADKLLIQLIQSDKELHILIEDDGRGFEIPNESKGRGLKNIESRVELLKGKVDIESFLDKGTSITIDIPISTKSGML